MTMLSRLNTSFVSLALGLALGLPAAAAAQSIDYGDAAGSDAASAPGDQAGQGRGLRQGHVRITPYIEAQQVALAEITPGSDILTYSSLAAGIDASIAGRNSAASVGLRYEHRFGWNHKTFDGDSVSGLARVSAAVVPHALQVEAGALAARSRIEGNGAALGNPVGGGDSVTQIYSVYAGPTLATHAGDVAIDGGYRIGYTRVDSPKAVVSAPGAVPADIFDDSIVHSARLHAGTRAGDALPVGLGVGVGYDQENISNLDQRARDFHARADVTLPVSSDLALVGGAGYEDVSISSRDVLRDTAGNPVVGPDGRYVTDKAAPRVMAYDTSGVIWDAGVMWRPSRRTALEAHFGRRYGSSTYYGSFAYAPNARSALNISVYDNIGGFGGQLNRALAQLPAEFQAVRNPISGNVGGCVSSLSSGSCLAGALGSVRSATFRARGVMATYGVNLGRFQYGIGAGHDRRTFIAAPGTVLAAANGVVDENTWLSGFLSGKIDQQSSFSTNIYANWFQSGFSLAGDAMGLGASAGYYRSLTDHLSASAALGIDGINREAPLVDTWSASAQFGVRYSF